MSCPQPQQPTGGYVYVTGIDHVVDLATGDLLSRGAYGFRTGSPPLLPAVRALPAVDAVTFRLGGELFVREAYGRCVNIAPPLARPTPPQPATTSAIRPWLDFLEYLAAGSGLEQELVGWMAWVAQNPQLRPPAHLVIGGASGIGKSMVLEPLYAALGKSAVAELLFGLAPGSEWLHRSKLLVLVSSISGAVDVRRLRRLAQARGDEPITIKRKCMRSYVCADTTAVIASTSSPAVAKELAADANLLVLWSTARIAPPEVYSNLVRWYAGGGRELAAQWLLDLDLSQWPSPFDRRLSAGLLEDPQGERALAALNAGWGPFEADIIALSEVAEWLGVGIGPGDLVAEVRLVSFAAAKLGARRLGRWQLTRPTRSATVFPEGCTRKGPTTLFSLRGHDTYAGAGRGAVLGEFWSHPYRAADRREPERPWLRLVRS